MEVMFIQDNSVNSVYIYWTVLL